MFKAEKISEDIYWVGALEWDERYIHGITMPYGSTNNAYIIMDEKITLIDTCVSAYGSQLIERISDIVDPSSISYIVSNHSEKDHAGSIAKVLEVAPDAQVVTSVKGAPILKTYLENRDFIAVKTGDELSIGKRTLHFTQIPMVHWPDSMVTFSPYDKILFSNDAFGQFIATSKRFDDQNNMATVMACAKKYYANILTPYVRQTAKALDAIEGLDLETIAPAHGVIWREHMQDIIKLYREMSKCEPDNSAVVVYSSMYGSTRKMAEAITEAFAQTGVKVRLYDVDISDISDIITDVFFAKYVACGSSTHNLTMLPTMGGFMTYLKGLSPKGRIGISFGSYGWSDAAQMQIADIMKSAGYEMPLDPISEVWNDSEDKLGAIFECIAELVNDSK